MQVPNTLRITSTSRSSAKPYALGWFMLAFIVLGTIGAGFGIWGNAPQGKSLLNGTWSAAFETQFNKALPWRETGINTWGILEYFLFGNGRSGVLVGQNGWLFSNEEFKFQPKASDNSNAHLAQILETKKTLEKSGAHLLVVVLPAKARVYPEQLGRYHFPSYYQTQYQDTIQKLRASGVDVLNVQSALLEAKSQQDVFIKTDTHWTPFGATTVATSIKNHLQTEDITLSETKFQTQIVSDLTYSSDLVKYLPLGSLQDHAPEKLEQFETQQMAGSGSALFAGSTNTDIVTLVGTSYSAKAEFHFEGALKQVLQADVLNMALEGKGPFEPMKQYLASKERQETKSSVVIWEIPERYLPMP